MSTRRAACSIPAGGGGRGERQGAPAGSLTADGRSQRPRRNSMGSGLVFCPTCGNLLLGADPTRERALPGVLHGA